MNSHDDRSPDDIPSAHDGQPGTAQDRRLESRVIPPSGPVSPDGKHPWPQHSLKTRLLVWGGIGIMTAAATAATVMTLRHVADAVSGDKAADRRAAPGDRPIRAPRFADMPEDQRDDIRARVRDQARRDAAEAANIRARAARRRNPPRRNTVAEITHEVRDLSDSLLGLVGTVTTAMAAFRTVADQAGAIRQEFSDVADSLGATERPAPRHATTAPDTRKRRDQDRTDA